MQWFFLGAQGERRFSATGTKHEDVDVDEELPPMPLRGESKCSSCARKCGAAAIQSCRAYPRNTDRRKGPDDGGKIISS